MQRTTNRHPLPILFSLAIAATVFLAARPAAAGFPHARRGTVLSVGPGAGGSTVEFSTPGGRVQRDVDGGVAAEARLGYAFSDYFALSLTAAGYGWENGGRTRRAGVGLLAATWYPGGGGFFLRAGVGSGRVTVREEGVDWNDREGEAVGGGLGYEWRVGPRFALGLAVDGYTVTLDDASGGDTTFSHAALSLQLNWYLR